MKRVGKSCESSSNRPTYALLCSRHRREKGAERIFEDIMAEILPNLMKYMYLQIQEVQ